MPNGGGKGWGPNTAPEGTAPGEGDFPAVPPTELYQHCDIRLVMRELGKIEEGISNLVTRSNATDGRIDDLRERIQSSKDAICDKVTTLEKELHGFKMAAIVGGAIISVCAIGFWYLEGDRIMAVLKPPPPAASSDAVPATPPKR